MPEKKSMDKPGSAAGLRLLTKKDVARLLACSIRMVERLVASGTLTAVKIRGAVRFRKRIDRMDRMNRIQKWKNKN
jgi:excisionase family DNA binding protein